MAGCPIGHWEDWVRGRHVARQYPVKTFVVVPIPVRLTVCGLPAALSVTLSVAVLVFDVVGVKVTLMLQLAPADSELPQV